MSHGKFAGIVLLSTALISTVLAYQHGVIACIPVEFSKTAETYPGYPVFAVGIMVAGASMFHYHLAKDLSSSAYIGLVASFLMSFIGIVNGGTDTIRIIHSVITLSSFLLYGIYSYQRGANKWFVLAAGVVLVIRYLHLASLVNWKGVF